MKATVNMRLRPVAHVRQGTLICPLDAQTVFDLHCKVYGAPSATFLYSAFCDFQKGQFNEVTLEAAKGKVKLKRTKEYKQKRYQLTDYEFIN